MIINIKYLIVFMLIYISPGYLLTNILIPKQSFLVRNMFVVVLSLFWVGLYSYYLSILEIPLNFSSYSISLIFLLIVYLVIKRYQSQKNIINEKKNFYLLWIPTIIVFFTFFIGFFNFAALQFSDDIITHCNFANYIYNLRSVFITYPSLPLRNTVFYSHYFYAYHSSVALMLDSINIPVGNLLIFNLVGVMLLFPLGLFMYCYELFKDKKLAFYYTLFVSNIYLFPYAVLSWSGLCQIIGISLIPFIVFSVIKLIKTENYSWLFVAGFLICTQLFIHPMDILSTIIILFFAIINIKERVFVKSNIIKGILLSIVVVIFSMPVLYKMFWIVGNNINEGSGIINRLSYPAWNTLESMFAGLLLIKNYSWKFLMKFFLMNRNVLLLVLFFIGIFLSIKSRKAGKILLGCFFLMLCYFVSSTTNWCNNVYSLIFPWGQPERILYLQIFFIPLIAAIGFIELINRLGHKRIIYVLSVIFFIIPVIYNIYNLDKLSTFDGKDEDHGLAGVVTDREKEAFVWLKENTDKGEEILGLDLGSEWIPYFSSRKNFLPEFYKYKLTKEENAIRTYIIDNIHNVDTDEKVQKLLKIKKIRYIYITKKYNKDKKELLMNKKLKKVFANERVLILMFD